MKEYYKLTREELFKCLTKAYEFGFHGPLDLAENVASSIIEDDLEKTKESSVKQNLWTDTIVTTGGASYQNYSGFSTEEINNIESWE